MCIRVFSSSPFSSQRLVHTWWVHRRPYVVYQREKRAWRENGREMIVTLLGRGRCVACGFGVQHSGNDVQMRRRTSLRARERTVIGTGRMWLLKVADFGTRWECRCNEHESSPISVCQIFVRGYANNVHRIDHSDDPHRIFFFCIGGPLWE